SLTVLAAAEQGQGLALTRWTLAAEDLATGRIVRASEEVVPCPRAYYFVCPESYLALPKVQELLEWLRESALAFPRPNSAAAPVGMAPVRVGVSGHGAGATQHAPRSGHNARARKVFK
ncbi:MAG: LysR substrate-binding domain-containing protein, partial [Steroidobacteraceae bacterium]